MEVLTVTQLTRAIRGVLEGEFGDVWVEGEVSNYRRQASGHQYFTLKDAQAQLSCVFFRGHARNSRVPIQDGAKLRLFGELSLYEARGQYQLVVKNVRPLGAGNLHERFEALKQKLRGEGLFDAERKRPIAKFPKRMAIITSPTGAVIRDLLSILNRRAPWVEILVYPTPVQGDGAYLEIIDGLEQMGARSDVDTIVLARGGGSLEDLWSFNEEALARAIVRCPLPVVSAIGHETDFSIADFVADLRAPTPSAAAELTVPDRRELRENLTERQRYLHRLVYRHLAYLGERLQWLERGGAFKRPRRALEDYSQRLDDTAAILETSVKASLRERFQALEAHRKALRMLSPRKTFARLDESLDGKRERLTRAAQRHLARWQSSLKATERHLQALGPSQTLGRGYSIILDEDRKPVVTVKELTPGRKVSARLQDGEVSLNVSRAKKKK